MPLNIESEIIYLVKDPLVSSSLGGSPAFHGPVLNGHSIDDDVVLDRLGYNQVRQDVLVTPFVPYLYWTGPEEYDQGQGSTETSGTKKANFWFWCCHATLTDSMIWANEIEDAVSRLVFPYNLLHCRLSAAIFIGKYPVCDDQTIKTAQGYPVSRAVIGYRFGYQSSGN